MINEFLKLTPKLSLTSLNVLMKREPKRHGLCRWHWSELTVTCEARWAAAATMNTASYIRAASVWHRHSTHFYTTPNADIIIMHHEKLVTKWA